MRVDKPWGYEEELKGTDRYSLWRLRINPGHETSLHCHSEKDVFLVVEHGPLEVEKLSGIETVMAGATMLIERGVYHRLKSPNGVTVLELEWPNNRDDITRREDKYGRCA